MPKLKHPLLLVCIAFACQAATASSVEGVVVSGGGIDDMGLVVETTDGKRIDAYCVDRCGDWFESTGQGDEQRLKRGIRGKSVRLEYAREPNRGRIAGLDADEPLNFIRSVRFLTGQRDSKSAQP